MGYLFFSIILIIGFLPQTPLAEQIAGTLPVSQESVASKPDTDLTATTESTTPEPDATPTASVQPAEPEETATPATGNKSDNQPSSTDKSKNPYGMSDQEMADRWLEAHGKLTYGDVDSPDSGDINRPYDPNTNNRGYVTWNEISPEDQATYKSLYTDEDIKRMFAPRRWVTMPNVEGMDAQAAVDLLHSKGFTTRVVLCWNNDSGIEQQEEEKGGPYYTNCVVFHQDLQPGLISNTDASFFLYIHRVNPATVPDPKVTPEPSVTPKPTPTPDHSVTSAPSVSPDPAATPDPSATP